MSDELLEALEKIFAADSELYQQRGFQRRIGFGKRPALINIDLANAWTRPGNPFSCLNMDVIIPATQQLLVAARAAGIPIVFTSTAYDAPGGRHSDMGLWHKKIAASRSSTTCAGVNCRLFSWIAISIQVNSRSEMRCIASSRERCLKHSVVVAISTMDSLTGNGCYIPWDRTHATGLQPG